MNHDMVFLHELLQTLIGQPPVKDDGESFPRVHQPSVISLFPTRPLGVSDDVKFIQSGVNPAKRIQSHVKSLRVL